MSAIKIYSSRGCGGPENTAAAFRAAFAAGADAASCDLRRTADGQFVAVRDPGTGRLCGRDWQVARTEWAHLKTLRVLDREPIAHIDDLLNILILRPCREFFFRLPDAGERDAADLARRVAGAGVQGRVFLTMPANRPALLAAARAAVPGLGLAVEKRLPCGLPDAARAAKAHRVVTGWGGGSSPCLLYAAASLCGLAGQLREAAAAGVEISAGPARHPRDVRRLKELGVAAVWTSDPEMAAKYS